MRDFPPVKQTALWLAGARVLEAKRRRPLVNDPYAAQLLGDEGLKAALALERAHPAPRAIMRRIRLVDELVIRYVRERAVQAVVMIGAGLDARPYRLDLPAELKWIELDYPLVTDWKNERLRGVASRCGVERVGADLTRPGSFVSAIGERCRGLRSLALMENLLHYFSLLDAQTLFREMACFGEGAVVIADLPNNAFEKSRLGRRMSAELETRQVAGRTAVDDVPAFAQALGFKVLETYPLACLNDDPASWKTAKCPWWASKSRAKLISVVVMEKM